MLKSLISKVIGKLPKIKSREEFADIIPELNEQIAAAKGQRKSLVKGRGAAMFGGGDLVKFDAQIKELDLYIEGLESALTFAVAELRRLEEEHAEAEAKRARKALEDEAAALQKRRVDALSVFHDAARAFARASNEVIEIESRAKDFNKAHSDADDFESIKIVDPIAVGADWLGHDKPALETYLLKKVTLLPYLKEGREYGSYLKTEAKSSGDRPDAALCLKAFKRGAPPDGYQTREEKRQAERDEASAKREAERQEVIDAVQSSTAIKEIERLEALAVRHDSRGEQSQAAYARQQAYDVAWSDGFDRRASPIRAA